MNRTRLNISDIKPNENNPRTITKKQFAKLVQSLRDFPEMIEAREIVVNTDHVILGGNMRYLAAKEAGVDSLPVKIVDWSEEKQREFIIKDNVSGGDWNWDELANEWDVSKLDEWGLEIPTWKDDSDGVSEYTKFVDKFKPKLTTDDCYTPPKVYEAVKSWAVEEYRISDNTKILRPFKPNGDYQAEDYSGDCVVIDNPPFSIFAEIVDFYLKNNVKFFLFMSGLTAISAITSKIREGHKVTAIFIEPTIEYENWAMVKTAFCTNMDDQNIVRCSKRLGDAINRVQGEKGERSKYQKPKNVITSAELATIAKAGDFYVPRTDAEPTRNVGGLNLYGAGLFVSDQIADELKRSLEVIEIRRQSKKPQGVGAVIEMKPEEVEKVRRLTANSSKDTAQVFGLIEEVDDD